MLQVWISTRYVGLDVMAHDVLVHPHLRVTQDLVAPHEDVVDQRGGGEREVRPVVVRVHSRQPEREGVREQCPVLPKQPLLTTHHAN